MNVFVKVKPGSKLESIKKVDATHFEVRTKSPPQEGSANAAVINTLARHFDIPKSRVRIIAGVKSRRKVFEIL